MRSVMLALLLVMLLPTVQAKEDTGDLTVDPDADADEEGAHASLTIVQSYPDNCADCGGIGVQAGAETDGEQTTVSATACRGGFVVICFIDEDVTV